MASAAAVPCSCTARRILGTVSCTIFEAQVKRAASSCPISTMRMVPLEGNHAAIGKRQKRRFYAGSPSRSSLTPLSQRRRIKAALFIDAWLLLRQAACTRPTEGNSVYHHHPGTFQQHRNFTTMSHESGSRVDLDRLKSLFDRVLVESQSEPRRRMMLQACVDYMALPQASVSSERRDILHHLVFTSSFPTTITLVDDDEPTGQDFLKDVLVPLLVEDPGLGDRDTYLQFLMQCRSDLLQILPREQQCQVGEDALDEDLSRFECFEESLRQLLKTLLFHQGDQWMQFRSITRDTKPQVLEILIQNEAVHPVETMAEYIDHRLGPTKRVFGLFLGPHQPAVVLHVSLQSDIPAAMSDLLDNDATATDPSVATFYSISNFHAGPFSGIGLGELLIYKVVVKLREELPSLKTFVTLSPMPRFRAWLEDMANNPKNEKSLELVDRLNDEEEWKAFVESCECEPHEGLSHVLYHATANEDWVDPAVMERLLTRLAAYYIAQEKDSFGKPIDGVARFHIANGAQVYRINYGADSSPNGWKNSFGCMVNYLYDLDSLKENQAQYRAEPQNLHVHNNVTSLLL